MRTQFMWIVAMLLLLLIRCKIVRGKFVKIENLHLKEVNEDGKNLNHWNNDLSSSSSSSQLVTSSLGDGNRTNALRGIRTGGGNGAKLLQSVNEVNLEGDASVKKEWKSFYNYPHHYNGGVGAGAGSATGSVLPSSTSAVPFGWSNGVINNNNLLSVGGYNPVATTTTVGAPFSYSGFGGVGAAPSTVQCLLFGVMGLVTFLLNSVMALLLSVKLPALDGLLGPLLGGLGLGALNKQEAVAADMKSKHNLEFIHFPDRDPTESGNVPEYFDKNR